MGCDIHAFIEYSTLTGHDGEPYWRSFGGRVGDRDYTMFGILAGARSSRAPLFAPRGVPDNTKLAYETRNHWLTYISDEPGDGSCTLADAQSWTAYGSEIVNDHAGIPRWVTTPDWHSASWLTYEEYAECYATYLLEADYSPDIEYELILSVMRRLHEAGHATRLVFWFDN